MNWGTGQVIKEIDALLSNYKRGEFWLFAYCISFTTAHRRVEKMRGSWGGRARGKKASNDDGKTKSSSFCSVRGRKVSTATCISTLKAMNTSWQGGHNDHLSSHHHEPATDYVRLALAPLPAQWEIHSRLTFILTETPLGRQHKRPPVKG